MLRTEEFGVARAAVIGPRFGREREVGDPFLGDDAFELFFIRSAFVPLHRDTGGRIGVVFRLPRVRITLR